MELKITTSRHSKTGKKYIDVAEIAMSYKGHKIQIRTGNGIYVIADDNEIVGFFKRNAPLLQILYFIEEYFTK